MLPNCTTIPSRRAISSSLLILPMIATLALLSSCSDVFEPAPPGSLPDDESTLSVDRVTAEWITHWNPNEGNIVNDIAVTPAGDIYVAGYGRIVDRQTGMMLVKFNPEGEPLWDKTLMKYSESNGQAVTLTDDGGCLVVGYGGPSTPHLFAARFSPDGDIVWDSVYDESSARVAFDVASSGDGTYMITGYVQPSGEYSDAFLIRMGGDGSILWEKRYGGSSQERGLSVTVATGGQILLTSEVMSVDAVSDPSNTYTSILMTDASGSGIHERRGGSGLYSRRQGVFATDDGAFIVAGGPEGASYFSSVTEVYRFNTDGTVPWRFVDSTVISPSIGLFRRSDGSYLCAGRSVYGINFSLNGLNQPTLNHYTFFPSYSAEDATAIASTPDGGMVIAGNSESPHLDTKSEITITKVVGK